MTPNPSCLRPGKRAGLANPPPLAVRLFYKRPVAKTAGIDPDNNQKEVDDAFDRGGRNGR